MPRSLSRTISLRLDEVTWRAWERAFDEWRKSLFTSNCINGLSFSDFLRFVVDGAIRDGHHVREADRADVLAGRGVSG